MDVGFIGLGRMGLPMAGHIQKQGVSGRLTLLDRFPERLAELVAGGAELAGDAREVARNSDLVILMVPAIGDIDTLLEGPDGLLAGVERPLILVVSSTTSAKDVRDLQARLNDRGAPVTVVDAPVSGGVEGAEGGSLSIMIGGPDAAAKPVVDVMSATGTAVHLGPLGAGQVAKACNQLIVSATIMALGEAAVLADRSGLDLAKLFDLLAGGYAGSRILATRGTRIVEQDYSPSGVAKYMVKDLNFATAVAESTDTHAVLLPALKSAFEELTAVGLGDNDISVARRFIAER